MSSETVELARKKMADRARCKTDKLFLAEMMGYDFRADVHTELFQQYVVFDPANPWSEQSDIKSRMVLWPRGHYKTFSVHVEIVQAIINFPDIRILIMQGTISITRLLLNAIRTHFTGEAGGSKIRELFPEFCAPKLGNQDSFTVPARKNKGIPQATVTVASPRKVKTGQHYDVGFFDDLINDQNHKSEKLVQKVQDDFYSMIPLIDPGGYRYVTGTRYVHGELYQVIYEKNLETKEWVISIKDCYSDDKKSPRMPPAMRKSDGSIYGFTMEGLESIKGDDPGMFSSQYLNRPAIEGTRSFDEPLLLSILINQQERHGAAMSVPVLFVDLASTEHEKRSDDSVVMCGRVDTKAVPHLVDFVGGTWSAETLAQQIIAMVLKHRPMKIMFENTASCKYFEAYFKLVCEEKKVFVPIDYIKSDVSKDAKAVRIGTLPGYMKMKKLRIFTENLLNPRWERLKEQFVTWPRAKYGHDDYPDTIALMVRELASMHLPTAQTNDPASKSAIFQMFAQAESDEIQRALLEQQLQDTDSWGSCGDDFSC